MSASSGWSSSTARHPSQHLSEYMVVTPADAGERISGQPTGSRTTFCLLRHGETDWNTQGRLQGREDIPINDVGREQARLAAEYLTDPAWELIASSPLRRALETAEIISAIASIPELVVVQDLAERDFGAASGLTSKERNSHFPSGTIPGWEEQDSVERRAIAALQQLAGRHPGQRIVVVSHGSLINAALAAATEGQVGTGKTRLANACLSVLHTDESAWEVEVLNSVDHLKSA